MICLGAVTGFSIGVLGIPQAVTAARQGSGAMVRRFQRGHLLAATAQGLCIAAVDYGLYLMIPQFH